MNPELRCVVCGDGIYHPTLYIVGGIPFCEEHYNSNIVKRAREVHDRVMELRRRKKV